MRHRWANTTILALIVLQVASGSLGLAAGASDRSFYLLLHNVGAFAILIVLGWKTAIGVRSLRRPASGRPRKLTLTLTLLLIATLVLGFTWPTLGYWSVAGTSGISLHIWTGLALTPLLGYHMWRYTRGFRVGYDADRRTAIRTLWLGGAGLVAWYAVEMSYRGLGLGAAERRFTGSHERGSFSGNAFPITSWINDDPDRIDRDSWRLRVVTPDRNFSEWIYPEIANGANASAPTTLQTTLDCTGGWYSTQIWTGPRIEDLIAPLPSEDVRTIEVRSVTGYYRKFAFDEAKDFVLATHVGDVPLSHGHGAPLRLVAPGRRGFEWVKWVTEVRLLTSSHWLQPPFPLQ